MIQRAFEATLSRTPKTLQAWIRHNSNQDITQVEIRKWLAANPAIQIKKKGTAIYPEANMYALSDGAWNADIMFLEKLSTKNRRYKAILVVIHVNGKMSFLEPLKTLSAIAVNDSFRSILTKIDRLKPMWHMQVLKSDNGSEFTSASFQKILAARGIRQELCQAGDKACNSIVERANSTIRNMIDLLLASKGTTNWVDELPKIEHQYNSRFHSKIGKAPVDFTEHDEDQAQITGGSNYVQALEKAQNVVVGDFVRLPLPQKKFTKTSDDRFSRKVFTVAEVKGFKIRVQDGKKWYHRNHVQVVSNDDDLEESTVDREAKARRFLRREGLI